MPPWLAEEACNCRPSEEAALHGFKEGDTWRYKRGKWSDRPWLRRKGRDWAPWAYTAWPDTHGSRRVLPEELYIDFTAQFVALEVQEHYRYVAAERTCRYVSAEVAVPDAGRASGIRVVYMNLAKGDRVWAELVPVHQEPSYQNDSAKREA